MQLIVVNKMLIVFKNSILIFIFVVVIFSDKKVKRVYEN
jgi:hypothetical protein